MTKYRVRWEIDVEADNLLDAVRAAREAQVCPGAPVTRFDVLECPYPGLNEHRMAVVTVDLGGPGGVPSVDGRPLPSSATAVEALNVMGRFAANGTV